MPPENQNHLDIQSKVIKENLSITKYRFPGLPKLLLVFFFLKSYMPR